MKKNPTGDKDFYKALLHNKRKKHRKMKKYRGGKR